MATEKKQDTNEQTMGARFNKHYRDRVNKVAEAMTRKHQMGIKKGNVIERLIIEGLPKLESEYGITPPTATDVELRNEW